MKSTGVTRTVDKMGRIVIPKEIRDLLKIQDDVDKFEIYMDGDKIILKKYQPSCVFCNTSARTVKYIGYNICLDCIEKLGALKDTVVIPKE